MGNTEITLSFVIPIYNVSKYLTKCLDSILNQTLDRQEYEVILVNDGSTDDSSIIAEHYAHRYPNIVLINQQNQGLSGARNAGILVSKGKYIQFVDADDYLEPNTEMILIEKMERENLDILRFNYQNVNDKYEVVTPNKSGKCYVDYSDSICDGVTFLIERLGFACYVCQFVFSSHLVRSQALFMEGRNYEDSEWTPRILSAANRVTSIDRVVYNYLIRDGSITRGKTIEQKRKNIEDKFQVILSMKSQMANAKDIRWYDGMISGTVISILGCVADDFYDEKKQYIKRLKQMSIFPISKFHLTKSGLRKRNVINISPLFFCFLRKLKNS